jgi:hypothetical protein
MNRWPIAFVLFGLLAAGLAYDQTVDMPSAVQSTETEQVVVSPSVGEPARLDGAWYCPIGSSSPNGFADHEVNISNLSDDPAVANLSILTGDGPGPGRRIELAPRSTERVKLSDTQAADVAAAVVEIIGGRGAVGHTVTTAQGVAEGPCATSASNTWYFAHGRTSRDSTQYLALMNPFPETAVFDVEFQAVGRSREPGPLQGAFVRARSVRLIDVGEFVRREEALATKITTARGRLVVERLQLLDGQLGPSGAAVQLGVPTPSPSWIFTAGRIHDSGDDLLTIYNPYEVQDVTLTSNDEDDEDEATADGGGASATDGSGAENQDPDREGFTTVSVELWPTNPTDVSSFSVVTIQREVRPGTFVTIDLRAQAERFEFPLPYELGVNVSSVEGLPIVAERWQYAERLLIDGLDLTDPAETDPATDPEADPAADPEADPDAADPDADPADPDAEVDPNAEVDPDADPAAVLEPAADLELQPAEPVDSGLPQPIADTGVSTSRGNELFSTRWVVPWVTMTNDSTLIAVASIDEAAVEVRVLSDGQFVGPIRATVAAGGRAIIPVTSTAGGAAVEITSNTPVSVEAVVVVPGQSLDVVPAIPTVAN